MASIKENIETIHERMAKAAKRAGRDPDSVKLVAVSKRQSVELIQEAIDAGQKLFGENFIQEAQEKITVLPEDITWHFIGHLQSNKAKNAAGLFGAIETIDRLKLAHALEKQLAAMNKKLSIFIQVNIGREPQKSGVLPEDIEPLLRQLESLNHLTVKGLMTMPPYFSNQEQVRPYFRKMRQLANNLQEKKLLGKNGEVGLSMGMSGDFEAAIEEGATLIRVGTALFGSRS
jgi:hypothetical protein